MVVTTAVAAAVTAAKITGCAVAVGAITNAVANLWSGSIGRKQTREEAEKQRMFSKFLQDRNFAEAARLQKEMNKITFEEQLKLQSNAFKETEANFEKTRFVDLEWPLLRTPKSCIADILRKNDGLSVPLQIVVADTLPPSMSDVMSGVRDNFNNYIGAGRSPVLYYDGGWKVKGHVAAAHIAPLYRVFQGLPFVLVSPTIEDQGRKFILRIASWGIGDLGSDHPFETKVVEMDLTSVRIASTRVYCDERIRLSAKAPHTSVLDKKCIDIRMAELQYAKDAEKKGVNAEELNNLFLTTFWYGSDWGQNGQRMYSYEQLIKENQDLSNFVQKAICDSISSAMTFCTLAVSDMYLLAAHSLEPRVLNNHILPKETVKTVRGMFDTFLSGKIASGSDDINVLQRPLHNVLVAKAFKTAGWRDDAKHFEDLAVDELSKLYRGKTDNIAKQHATAVQIMLRNDMIASDSPIAYLGDSVENPVSTPSCIKGPEVVLY